MSLSILNSNLGRLKAPQAAFSKYARSAREYFALARDPDKVDDFESTFTGITLQLLAAVLLHSLHRPYNKVTKLCSDPPESLLSGRTIIVNNCLLFPAGIWPIASSSIRRGALLGLLQPFLDCGSESLCSRG